MPMSGVRIHAARSHLRFQCKCPYRDILASWLKSADDFDMMLIGNTQRDHRRQETLFSRNEDHILAVYCLDGLARNNDVRVYGLDMDTGANKCTGREVLPGSLEYAACGERTGFVRDERADIFHHALRGVAVVRHELTGIPLRIRC